MRDDRPLKLIRRTPVDGEHVARLEALAEVADAVAANAGKDLQSEFGKQHVALIIGCNQFARFYRDGEHAGRIELWLTPEAVAELEAAGGQVTDAVGGAVFQMFGWRLVDPTAMPEAVEAALKAAAGRALTSVSTTAF